MRKITSVKAETKPNSVKPKICVKVDSSSTTKQKVNLKKSVSVADPNQQQHNSLNNIERLVEVPNTNPEFLSNKKFLKSISLNNGSSIQNRIYKKQPIRNLDDSFWGNGVSSVTTSPRSTLTTTASSSSISQSNTPPYVNFGILNFVSSIHIFEIR